LTAHRAHGQESNSQPLDHKSDALAITLAKPMERGYVVLPTFLKFASENFSTLQVKAVHRPIVY